MPDIEKTRVLILATHGFEEPAALNQGAAEHHSVLRPAQSLESERYADAVGCG